MSQEEWSIPSQAAQNFRGFWGCSDGPVTQVLKLPVKETCRAKPCGRDNMYTHTHRHLERGLRLFFHISQHIRMTPAAMACSRS